MRRMDQEMNGLWVYEKDGSRDEWIMSLWEGWIKRWMEYESMRRKDQEMNGFWVYEKDGSRDEWIMSLWEGRIKGWMEYESMRRLENESMRTMDQKTMN